MTKPETPRRRLPDRPSQEHLRKAAKRLAKAKNLKLAAAQRRLAHDHGYRNWAALMRAVDEALGAPQRSPLSAAAARADEDAVRALLAAGAAVDGEPHERDTPLFLTCDSDAPSAQRIAVAKLLLEAGAFTRRGCENGATPLHAAARRGPFDLVVLLMQHGALAWQPDASGRRPYDYARDGAPVDRDAILEACADGPLIRDQYFRAAVDAIHAGDLDGLRRLLDAHPDLLRERAVQPAFQPKGYFTDPKLFWFIANNPTLVPGLPDNIVAVAELMIARGVEKADLDYAHELVMTNGCMPQEQQIALVGALTRVGAAATPGAVEMTLGHAQSAPIAWLVDRGLPMSVTIAAGLGRIEELKTQFAGASGEEITDALGMAVINRQAEAARLCLEAGADPDRFLPCHSHSTPLHHAALNGDVSIIRLLAAHGARLDIKDTLWRSTPLGWASYCKQPEAEACLRALAGESGAKVE